VLFSPRTAKIADGGKGRSRSESSVSKGKYGHQNSHGHKKAHIHTYKQQSNLIYFQNVLTESTIGPEYITCVIQYLIFSNHEHKYEI
jgi:hypothetical protein